MLETRNLTWIGSLSTLLAIGVVVGAANTVRLLLLEGEISGSGVGAWVIVVDESAGAIDGALDLDRGTEGDREGNPGIVGATVGMP